MKAWPRRRHSMRPVHVVALGGSLLRPEEANARTMWMGQLRQLMVHLEGNDRRIGLVVGGGLPARNGIQLASETVQDPHRLDEVGIAATRLNATILQQVMLDIGCDVASVVPHTVDHARQLLDQHHIVVMGGTVPGQTTDTVAVKLAAAVHARHCIIATNVSHVHNKDPRRHEDAVAFTDMTLEELGGIVGVGKPLNPGDSAVVDPIAVSVAIDAGLDLAVLDGRDIGRLDKALDGALFEGTLVRARGD